MKHHEPNLSEEIMNKVLAEQLGPTGKFPDGKLTENDEGELLFAIGAIKGKVVLNFGTPIASAGFSPEQAKEIGQALIRRAEECELAKMKGAVGSAE